MIFKDVKSGEVIRHNPMFRYRHQEIIWYKGLVRQYKSTLEVNDALWLFNPKEKNHYKPENLWSTLKIELDGSHMLHPDEMIDFILWMDANDVCDTVLVIDQAERVFGARDFKNPNQGAAANTLWQMAKRNNQVFGTCSPDKSIDLIARNAATMIVMPECIEGWDDCGMTQQQHIALGRDSSHRRRENDVVIESIIWPDQNIYQDRCYQVTGLKFVQDNWFDSFASVRKSALPGARRQFN